MASRRASSGGIEITIDQHAVLASGGVALAALAVWWALSFEWSALGKHKAPIWLAALAVVTAAWLVQRYIRVLRERFPSRED